jgi:Holliday junction resolvasome RuvABC endonuclease subunit
LKLGFVRAIALLAAAQKNMTVQDFTPCQIKEILTGTGKATKTTDPRQSEKFIPIGNTICIV